uniref:Uncharacterized protein n=1 Tax=Arundo donax TaxID=35708 RepID=A0A0A8YWV0_ARUDO
MLLTIVFFLFWKVVFVRRSDKMFTFQLPNNTELICKTYPS